MEAEVGLRVVERILPIIFGKPNFYTKEQDYRNWILVGVSLELPVELLNELRIGAKSVGYLHDIVTEIVREWIAKKQRSSSSGTLTCSVDVDDLVGALNENELGVFGEAIAAAFKPVPVTPSLPSSTITSASLTSSTVSTIPVTNKDDAAVTVTPAIYLVDNNEPLPVTKNLLSSATTTIAASDSKSSAKGSSLTKHISNEEDENGREKIQNQTIIEKTHGGEDCLQNEVNVQKRKVDGDGNRKQQSHITPTDERLKKGSTILAAYGKHNNKRLKKICEEDGNDDGALSDISIDKVIEEHVRKPSFSPPPPSDSNTSLTSIENKLEKHTHPSSSQRLNNAEEPETKSAKTLASSVVSNSITCQPSTSSSQKQLLDVEIIDLEEGELPETSRKRAKPKENKKGDEDGCGSSSSKKRRRINKDVPVVQKQTKRVQKKPKLQKDTNSPNNTAADNIETTNEEQLDRGGRSSPPPQSFILNKDNLSSGYVSGGSSSRSSMKPLESSPDLHGTRRRHQSGNSKRSIPDNDGFNEHGFNEFHLAVKENRTDLVLKLLWTRSGVDINLPARDFFKSSALHLAAWHIPNKDEAIQMIKILIKHNANVNCTNSKHKTFIESLLYDGGGKKKQKTPPITSKQFQDLVKILIDFNKERFLTTPFIQTEQRSRSRVCVLHWAMKIGIMGRETIHYLHFKGNYLNFPSEVGENAMLYYAIWGWRGLDMIDFLVSLGANLRHRNISDWNLLHVAARFRNLDAFEYIIQREPRFAEEFNRDGLTPVDIFRRYGSKNEDMLRRVDELVRIYCTIEVDRAVY